MAQIVESEHIDGVKIIQLQAFGDKRGRFMETFRTEWFPDRSWNKMQTNRSDSRAGVLRGLHYHFNQVDYWYFPNGTVRVGLADLRLDSPTAGVSQALEIGEEDEMGVYVPSGVAHGFLAVTDATLMYVVDQYYDPNDELGVAWNDPDLNVAWGVDAADLSDRDYENPKLSEIDIKMRPSILVD